MPDFTLTQGRYLSFIQAYTNLHGIPPAEDDIVKAIGVSPPSVHQMVKTLERKGLITRRPGLPRTIKILVPEDKIPVWKARETAKAAEIPGASSRRPAPAVLTESTNVYVLLVAIIEGRGGGKIPRNAIRREIEIRSDQTLVELHHIIFIAFDRYDEHLYEFQFGNATHDPKGARYGIVDRYPRPGTRDAMTARLDKLDLAPGGHFFYWFDFGDDWFHRVEVVRIDQPIPNASYPRITKRVGESPDQYPEED